MDNFSYKSLLREASSIQIEANFLNFLVLTVLSRLLNRTILNLNVILFSNKKISDSSVEPVFLDV